MHRTGTAGLPGAEVSGNRYGRRSILHRVGVELAEERGVRVRGAWAVDARGYAGSRVSGVSSCGVCGGGAIATSGDAGAGGGGFGDVFCDRADCGAAGGGKFGGWGGPGGVVAGGGPAAPRGMRAPG